MIEQAIANIDETLLPLCAREIGRPDPEPVRRLIREVLREVDQIWHCQEQLFEQLVDLEAGRDVLTQLLNRRFLGGVLGREIAFCSRSRKQFAVMLADIDDFKSVNDTYGHSSGDRVLQQVASCLGNGVRSGDSLFRYGGEEFLVVAVEVDATAAAALAEKLRAQVSQMRCLLDRNRTTNVTVSIGVAVYDGRPDYLRLIERADSALYRAKQEGRNCCVTL